MCRYIVTHINAPPCHRKFTSVLTWKSTPSLAFKLNSIASLPLHFSSLSSSHSSVIMSDRGCAQDENGNLLSPSKIQWYNDVDDEAPMPGSNAAASSSPAPPPVASSSKFKPSTITRFFVADNVAGSRRSNRTTRPSARVTDPDNMEARAFFAPSRKRKASSSDDEQQPRRLQKVAQVSEEEPDDVDEGDASDDVVELTEKASSDEDDVEATYEATKALGDADRKVSVCLLYIVY